MSSDTRPLTSLLAALQYGDSAYPAGGFAQSWGLETAVAEGAVRSAADLEDVCGALLRFQAGPVDAVAAAACARLDSSGMERFAAIDRRVSACRPAREPRQASERQGRRLIDTAASAEDDSLLTSVASLAATGNIRGNFACVLGLFAGRLGLSPEEAAGLLLWTVVNGMLAAALRLLPITHDDVQRTLTRLRPLMAELARDAATRDASLLAGGAPQFEIWSMRHETGRTRLFAS